MHRVKFTNVDLFIINEKLISNKTGSMNYVTYYSVYNKQE